ncbi:hypothetical protein Pmani_031366, partial [Petrolisthes manimaculis]
DGFCVEAVCRGDVRVVERWVEVVVEEGGVGEVEEVEGGAREVMGGVEEGETEEKEGVKVEKKKETIRVLIISPPIINNNNNNNNNEQTGTNSCQQYTRKYHQQQRQQQLQQQCDMDNKCNNNHNHNHKHNNDILFTTKNIYWSCCFADYDVVWLSDRFEGDGLVVVVGGEVPSLSFLPLQCRAGEWALFCLAVVVVLVGIIGNLTAVISSIILAVKMRRRRGVNTAGTTVDAIRCVCLSLSMADLWLSVFVMAPGTFVMHQQITTTIPLNSNKTTHQQQHQQQHYLGHGVIELCVFWDGCVVPPLVCHSTGLLLPSPGVLCVLVGVPGFCVLESLALHPSLQQQQHQQQHHRSGPTRLDRQPHAKETAVPLVGQHRST